MKRNERKRAMRAYDEVLAAGLAEVSEIVNKLPQNQI